MSTVMTRGDSIRAYFTGAASAGGAQASANACLGNHRSSTEATSFGTSIANAIANITIDFVSGGNVTGDGSLDCVDANTLRWKDLGGTYGDAVAIANGETKVLEAAGRPGAYIRVTRTSATDLVAGTATVTLTPVTNNVFGFDDVTSGEATAGDTEYRAVIEKNVASGTVSTFKMWLATLGTQRVSASAQLGGSGAGTITISSGTFADWPESGWCHIKDAGVTREIVYYTSRTNTSLTVPSAGRARLGTSAAAGANTDTLDAVPGIAIGIDTAGVQAAGSSIQTIANEGTAPTSVTFNTGLSAADGLNIGTMTTGQEVGIWFKREIPAGATSTPQALVATSHSFDAA